MFPSAKKKYQGQMTGAPFFSLLLQNSTRTKTIPIPAATLFRSSNPVSFHK